MYKRGKPLIWDIMSCVKGWPQFPVGRIHLWFEFCLHPNFGLSGIRDFEHFESFTGPSRILYPHMGTQLLSLFLGQRGFSKEDANRRKRGEEDITLFAIQNMLFLTNRIFFGMFSHTKRSVSQSHTSRRDVSREGVRCRLYDALKGTTIKNSKRTKS
jgi:hypothetical protein